jgi:phosphatidylinositol alpha-1,6-mannosyltransferase
MRQTDFDVKKALLFCFGSRKEGGHHDGGPAVYAGSRPSAIIAALRVRWPVRLVLVWHLAFLKLLPFFRVSDARVVLFLHGIEAWRRQDLLTRGLLRRVNFFLSNSDHTWHRFLTFNPRLKDRPHKTVHLGMGVPIERPIQAPGQPLSVLMISRLLRTEDYKGHREMIAAWSLVHRRVPEAELWIVGGGNLRRDLEERVRACALDGQIRFWGKVSEAEKKALLERSRCLAMPSRGEGFGLVYLEAMRLGRPCLVSTLDAGHEVLNPPEAGLAADPSDPEELAAAICRLLSDGAEWETWSRQARERYEARFTARHFQERLLAALDPLLSCAESLESS